MIQRVLYDLTTSQSHHYGHQLLFYMITLIRKGWIRSIRYKIVAKEWVAFSMLPRRALSSAWNLEICSNSNTERTVLQILMCLTARSLSCPFLHPQYLKSGEACSAHSINVECWLDGWIFKAFSICCPRNYTMVNVDIKDTLLAHWSLALASHLVMLPFLQQHIWLWVKG